MSAEIPAVDFAHVSFGYGETPALENVSLRFERGSFLALVGPNGGGKSTFVRLVLGLLEAQSGRVTVLGKKPQEAARRIGYVPQFALFERDMPISVRELVLQGRLGKRAWWRRLEREDFRVAEASLGDTGIADLADRPIGSLSGGQLQRALLARALATEPELLVLDEPTASVDTRAEQNLFARLADLRTRMSILVVSHDIGLVSRHVDSVACLNRRLVCHSAPPLQPGALEELYGMPLRLVDHLHETVSP